MVGATSGDPVSSPPNRSFVGAGPAGVGMPEASIMGRQLGGPGPVTGSELRTPAQWVVQDPLYLFQVINLPFSVEEEEVLERFAKCSKNSSWVWRSIARCALDMYVVNWKLVVEVWLGRPCRRG